MSVKADILAALKTALSAITVDNGYSVDVRQVLVGAESFSKAKEYTPSITIVEGNESKLAEDAINVLFGAELGITVLMKAALTENLYSDINGLSADVKKVLYGSPSLGAYALDLRVVSVDNGTAESFDMSWSMVAVNLIYYAPKASF